MTHIEVLPSFLEPDPDRPGHARRIQSPAQASASNTAALMAAATKTRRTDRTMPPSEGGYAVVHLVLPYPPSTNTAYNPINGVMLKSKEAREYAKAVVANALSAGCPLLDGDIMVTLYVFRPRKTGDLVNREKVLIDSLKGILWRDDELISAMPMYRFEDKGNPRVELTAVGRLADLKGEE